MGVEIRLDKRAWSNSIDVAIIDRRANCIGMGRLTFDEISDGSIVCPPTATINQAAAQQMMDELWQCGLRPSEGSGSAGSLAATERHLKDMQAIAVGLLRKSGVDVR